MVKIHKTKVLLLAIVLLLPLFTGFTVNRAGAEGITVAPAFLEVSLTKAEPVKYQAVSVKNDFNAPVAIEASVKGIDQQGDRPVPSDQIDVTLEQAITIINPVSSIGPNDSVNIQLEIKDNPELAGGGHFASLYIKQLSDKSSEVSLQPVISVSMYIIKEEGAKRALSISNIIPKHSIFTFPKSVDITFENKGNVLIVPRAAILASGQGMKKRYGIGTANEKSAPVLPGNNITLRTPLTQTGRPWLPGKYEVYVQYRIDGAPNSAIASKSFWYLPVWYLLLIPLGILLFRQARILRFKSRRRAVSKRAKRPRGKKQGSKAKKIKIQIK